MRHDYYAKNIQDVTNTLKYKNTRKILAHITLPPSVDW